MFILLPNYVLLWQFHGVIFFLDGKTMFGMFFLAQAGAESAPPFSTEEFIPFQENSPSEHTDFFAKKVFGRARSRNARDAATMAQPIPLARMMIHLENDGGYDDDNNCHDDHHQCEGAADGRTSFNSAMYLNSVDAATCCHSHQQQSSSLEFVEPKPSMPPSAAPILESEGASSPLESSSSSSSPCKPRVFSNKSWFLSRPIFFTSSNTAGRRRRGNRTIKTTTVALLSLITLLLPSSFSSTVFAAAAAAAVEIPEGLLFASEMRNLQQSLQEQHVDSRIRRGSSSREERNQLRQQQLLLGDDDDTNEVHRRRHMHPIHRIYRGEGARIRRRVEEIENSLPYFRTGKRGDPNHQLQYRNHPFDRLRREKDRMREMKEQQQNQRRTDGDEKDIIEDVLSSRNLEAEGGDGSIGESGDDNPFRPIRIHLDTTAIDEERTEANGAQIDFVKDIILPRMRDFWASALSVVPVSGNVVISSAELQGRLYCGDSEFSKVPASHISVGVEDTDLILYVSGAPSARFCGPTTLAVAVACNFDQVRESVCVFVWRD